MAIKSYKREMARADQIRTQWPPVDDPVYRRLGVTRDQLVEMTQDFRGQLVFPGSPDYNKDRQGNPLYPSFPEVIAYCEVPNDVRLCLDWAHVLGLWVTCRSGGHSTAGYSVNSGMVIDTSRIKYVSVDQLAMTARVGAGTDFGHFDTVLNEHRLHVPGGGCPDVCVAGYMQGGGYGFTSREYGMNCDNVLEFTMMRADGTIVTANENDHRELFWAVRGGTGDNFGVLLEVTYRLYPLWKVWGFALVWSLSDAPAVLAELQQNYMMTGAPKELGYQAFLATSKGNKACVVLGMFHGSRDDGLAAIKSLQGIGTPTLAIDTVGTYKSLNEGLLYGVLTPPTPTLIEYKQSGYIAETLTEAQWQTVVKYFSTAPNEYALVGLEAYGGAIKAYPSDGNAFIHRNVACDFFVDSFFDPQGTVTSQQEALKWLNGFMTLMQPYFNGEVYQNYPVRDLPNFREAYWGSGSTFDKLLKVKKAYDPTNFFHFEQSISPASVAAGDTHAVPSAARPAAEQQPVEGRG